VLAALYSAAGCALMVLIIWHQLDPDAPTEWWERVRERVRSWRNERRALVAQLEEIQLLPEADEEGPPCEES
jgi:hypothetical protein